MLQLRDFFASQQAQVVSWGDQSCQDMALQYVCEHAMPQACRLVLHYFDKSRFTDDPMGWLLGRSAVADVSSLPVRPMLCQYNKNRVARALISYGWQLPSDPNSTQRTSISEDMRHFQAIRERQGNPKKPTDELVPKPLLAIKRLAFQAIGHEDIAAEIKGALYAHSIHIDGRPLVLMFAGPSGHGKTEMAQGIASLLQEIPLSPANSIVIPCGSISTKTELFGLAGAYRNSHIDSALNKFIRDHQGRRGVVILDEFEKLDNDAQEGLLEPFDTGISASFSLPLWCMYRL